MSIRTPNDDTWKAYRRAIEQMRERLTASDNADDIGVMGCDIFNACEIGRDALRAAGALGENAR